MPLEVISLGAGVQSTAMALMAAHGEIEPMPDYAIFADTGDEPRSVYDHLDWLRSGNVLPFPVEIVQFSHLGNDVRLTAAGVKDVAGRDNGYLAPPFFTLNEDGSHGMLRRECTSNYKIRPIQRHLKVLLGRDPDEPIRVNEPLVRQWIGISADEALRVKQSQVRWVTNWHPLVDQATREGPGPHTRWMSRQDCLAWIERHGYPTPPRSACIMCPYKSNAEWRQLRDQQPEAWESAVEFDALIRDMPDYERAGLHKGGKLFLHRSLVPLAEAPIGGDSAQPDLWVGECEGMCGV